MFQNFDPVSDRSFASRHLPLLRDTLKTQGLDGFIVPHDDEYQNEYIPDYAERLMWATGFSGSAGSAIIFADHAVIFTDGRYTLQVRQEADDAFFDYVDISTTSPAKWLKENAPANSTIGYDPMLHPLSAVKQFESAASARDFTLIAVNENPVDAAWREQPPRPSAMITPHAIEFAGKSSHDKRADIANALKSKNADAVLVTAPPSLAWLFNIRGGDVARSPLPLGRALLRRDGTAMIFLAPEKIDNALAEFLGDEVDIRPEAALEEAINDLAATGAKVAIDPSLTPSKYVSDLQKAGAKVVHLTDPCALPRAVKNNIEINGARTAHIRDGVAVTRFLHWLDTHAQNGSVDEISAAKKLEAIRTEATELRDLSFDTISGAGSNGAICHYKVSTTTNQSLESNSLYLVDSGGQYPDGTTDITRTVPIGTPTEEMRDRFTRVLKGHIALAVMKFPAGTTGHQLDTIARRPLWDAGLDYDHGTGHGVGSFLGVHEGPQRISKAPSNQALKPGMILSNEPGFYKANEFGIRIENLIVVTPPQPVDGGDREMMAFETITLAPINLDLVVLTLLSEDERHWLNAYHDRVRATLKAAIPDDIKDWFENATRPI